jgi:ABC-2 type transport system ATP-binding protein
MNDAIAVHDLRKSFVAVEAVRGISFSVAYGEIFGFLGPNGAGKSTTINLLTGLARADEGRVAIGGIDCTRNPRAAQHLIGVVADESNLYPELDGFANLCFCGALYGMKRADREERARALLATFDLTEAAARRFAGYSKGMKRRLTIAAAIMPRPTILFLDEPTTGLDVGSARQVRQLILDLKAAGTTVFLTTHNIGEAEALCDRVAFLVKGRIIQMDSVAALVEPVQARQIVNVACDPLPEGAMARVAAAFPNLEVGVTEPGLIRIESASPVPVGPVVRLLEEAGATVTEARRQRLSLEDVFVDATGIAAAAMVPRQGAAAA